MEASKYVSTTDTGSELPILDNVGRGKRGGGELGQEDGLTLNLKGVGKGGVAGRVGS